MKNLTTLIKKEFLELSRTSKLLVIVVIMLFIALGSPITAKLLPDLLKNMNLNGIVIQVPEATWHDAIDQFMKNLGQIGIMVLIFVFAGSVAEEKQKKTFEILLTKPVKRTEVILGKLLSTLVAVLGVFAIGVTVFIIYTNTIFSHFGGEPVSRFLQLSMVIAICLVTVLSVTIAISTFSKSYLSSLAWTSLLYLIGMPLLSLFDRVKPYMPDYVFSQYQKFLGNGDLLVFTQSIAVSVIVSMMSMALAIWSFSKQEVER